MYRLYRPRIEAICANMGIINVEDAASEILCRFIERGFMEKFDPDYVTVADGRYYPARFSTFICAFAERYARGIRDRERRSSKREHLKDELIDTESFETPDQCWSDELIATVKDMQARVAELPKVGRRDLEPFFAALLAQVLEGRSEIDRNIVARELSISVSTVGNWIYMVREEIEPWADRLR
jgi:hypothetical protein